jgi:hypothetical protein
MACIPAGAETMRTNYACWYKLDETFAFFIWYSNERDGVVLDKDDYIVTVQTVPQLSRFAQRRNLIIEDQEPTFYDLDFVSRWVQKASENEIDCPRFLNAWNLFTDVASSLGDATFPGNERRFKPIYDKLFWGNNLPSMTPPGEFFVPDWDDQEFEQMAEVLSYGLHMFRNHIKR